MGGGGGGDGGGGRADDAAGAGAAADDGGAGELDASEEDARGVENREVADADVTRGGGIGWYWTGISQTPTDTLTHRETEGRNRAVSACDQSGPLTTGAWFD